MDSIWTDELILNLKDLWAGGGSAAVIAGKLRITRNAVLGKVHRLKLEKRSNRNGFYYGPVREVVQRTAPLRIRRGYVLKMPDRKPTFHPSNPEARPGLLAVMSPITGAFLNVKRRLPYQAEMTKNELRALLTQAVINTALMT